jgi:hypothetical protein
MQTTILRSKTCQRHIKLNKREKFAKSLWSSGNEIDVVSPIELSLKNLNFTSLVNKGDDSEKHLPKENANNISLGEDNDEKSVRMDTFEGYDTPYLGMKINPSRENLMKNMGEEVSDEDDDTFAGLRVIQNKNKDCHEKRVDAVNMIMNIKFDDYLSDESIGNDQLQKEADPQPRHSRMSRQSGYYESVRDYNMRSSRGKSLFTKFNNHNDVKWKDPLDKIIWGGFHKIVRDNSNDPTPQFEQEDDEAMFIEGALANSVDYPKEQMFKRKKINRTGKSSVGIKPYYNK